MFRNRIFKITSNKEFEQLTLEIFRYQAVKNPIYNQFLEMLKFDTSSVKQISQIPFLPIYFFKRFEIIVSILRRKHVKIEDLHSDHTGFGKLLIPV